MKSNGKLWLPVRFHIPIQQQPILEGPIEPSYPEQITKLILKSLGVDNDDAEAIAFKVLEPLPEE